MQNNLDDRLACADLRKLSDISGKHSLDAPPFYNCFFNRVVDDSDAGTREEPRVAAPIRIEKDR